VKVSLVALFALAGCGSKDGDSPTQQAVDASTSETATTTCESFGRYGKP
jgi:hypothetical protein